MGFMCSSVSDPFILDKERQGKIYLSLGYLDAVDLQTNTNLKWLQNS